MRKLRATTIAIAAMMIAITTVFTIVVKVPIVPRPGSYWNFSDVAIYFASLTFGPWFGLVAGGIGTALGDIILGAPHFAPLSFLAHGLEGLVVGLLTRRLNARTLALGWIAGAVVMVGLYFLGEGFIYYSDWKLAWLELPWNLLQNAVGGVLGIPLFYLVRRAYPPVTRLGRGEQWREE